MNKTQKGRSMVEMLGVLAIVGVLSVGGIMAYNMAMTKFKTTKQMDQIQMIMTNVKTLFASSSNYTGLDNGVLVGLGVMSANDAKEQGITSGTVAVDNAFGGQIVVAANTGVLDGKLGSAVANGSYYIEIDNMPRNACATIANSDWGDADSGLLNFKVGTEEIYDNLNGSRKKATIAEISSACAASNVVIRWDIK